MEIANVTFSIADLVNRGVHLGHPRSQWNPKMAPYIYTNRNDVCIINLYRTIKQLNLLSAKLSLYSSQDKTFLFVGTKRQASEILENFSLAKTEFLHREAVEASLLEQSSSPKVRFGQTESTLSEQSYRSKAPHRNSVSAEPELRSGLNKTKDFVENWNKVPTTTERSLFYVNQRWLGGMLTNWQTIKKSLQTLERLETQESEEAFLKLPKKEATLLRKRKERLQKYLGGLKGMKNLPDVVIILGQKEEMNAVLECQKLGITTISVLDTDCDPTLTDLFVVANDDSKKSLDFLCTVFLKSISLGRKK